MPLFDEQLARKPDLYPWARDFINACWSSFWTPNEFLFTGDRLQFLTEMTEQERQIMVRTLSCIGQVEIAVKTFWARLGDNLPHPSIKDLGYVLAQTEVIHNYGYEKLLTVLGLEDIFEENLKVPEVAGRVAYLRKYLDHQYDDNRRQYIYAIILFTIFVEDVSLFSQFYIGLWFNKKKNLLKDVAQQIAYTRNEETLHARVGMKLINTLRLEYPELFDTSLEELIYTQCRSALVAEERLIDWIIGDYAEEGISASILKAYIQQRMNEALAETGFSTIADPNPGLVAQTAWMDEVLLGDSRTDFFFKKPIGYAHHDRTFAVDDIFA